MSVGVFDVETGDTREVANKSRTAIIDSEMSEESQNPLQNRIITQKITELNQSIEELNTLLNGMDETLGGKLDVSKIANNLITTEEGYALDARMGKVLSDEISKSIKKNETIETTASSWGVLPSWNRNDTPLKMKGNTGDVVYPLASLPTKNGEWVIGAHGATDILFLAFYETGIDAPKMSYYFSGTNNGIKNM